MAKKRIALFGGTFDPIHIGHTIVAAKAAECIGAQEVIFIPAKCSPLKQSSPQASEQHRLHMIALAIADCDKFQLSCYELKKSGPSYTLQTVRYFQEKSGSSTSIYWLAGADSVDDLSHWYRFEQLIDECNLCVMFRAGCPTPDFAKFESLWGEQRVEKLQRNVIETPLVNISSTKVRKRIAAGLDITGMLNEQVVAYIFEKNLYRRQEP